MKRKIDITFIIPIYNKTIDQVQKCLASIKQLNSNIISEIIIIDDGSNNKLGKEYKRLSYKYDAEYLYEKNKGVSFARNIGIKKAKGKYISFVDADDNIIPSAIHSKDLDNKSELILYNVIKSDQQGKYKKIYKFVDIGNKPTADQLLKYSFKEGLINWSVAKLYLRTFLLKHQIWFNDKLKQGEDLDFVLRILKEKPIISYFSRDMYIYNFSTLTGDEREKNNPLIAFDNAKATFNSQQKILNIISLDKRKKERIDKMICEETIKAISRIYSIFLNSYPSEAKQKIKLFNQFISTIKSKHNYSLQTKVRIRWFESQNFFMIKTYFLVRNLYHKLSNK